MTLPIKSIALCINLPDSVLTDSLAGKKYPGAGWIPHFVKMARADGYQVFGRDAQFQDAKDLIVIQEENNELGKELIQRGADARVNYCMESPIFTRFYDKVPKGFQHSILFDKGTEHLYFPSFDDSDLEKTFPWDKRSFMCMVTSNKHYSTGFQPKESPSYRDAMDAQLHDYRYKAIGHFMGTPGFKLYGRGWPADWGCEIEDKLSVIKGYQYALCFENGAYPGYITEKIIDCLVAGVIPVYMGAPDIEEYVPPGLFVNARRYPTFADMEHDLHKIPEWQTKQMIKVGQGWLKNDKGRRYNNKVFAARMMGMCV